MNNISHHGKIHLDSQFDEMDSLEELESEAMGHPTEPIEQKHFLTKDDNYSFQNYQSLPIEW